MAGRNAARAKAGGWLVIGTGLMMATVWLGLTNAVLIERIVSSFAGMRQETLYRPLAAVRGAPTPASLPATSPEARTITDEALAAAEAYVAARGTIGFLVWHDGVLQTERYWNGNFTTRTDSLSMHKSVAALAIGIALDEGAIAGLDDPVGRYIREWRNDPRGAMTVRHVLTMATGLHAERMRPMPPNAFYRMMMGNDVTGGTLATDAVEKPGERFVYVNTNTQILEIVLERATGRAYADFVGEKLWGPLGNEDAFVWLDRPGGSPRVFCCMMSNARNWLRIGRMIAEGGRVGDRQIVSSAFLKEMLGPSPTNANYGFQIWRGVADPSTFDGTGAGSIKAPREGHLAADLVYLAGFGAQRTYVSPRCGLVIVRTGAQIFDWDDSILPNTVLRGLKDKSCWQNGAIP
jgi:CubicO group peptidase (beta-lactamase class C family)